MTLPQDVREQALSYTRHQASKSLAELAALMERTGADCARALEGVSEAQASFTHGEEWSMRQIVEHMVGSTAGVNREIANLASGKAAPPIQQLGQTARRERPIDELRRQLAELWSETARLVASLPEDGDLEATWAHPWFGELNFKEWIAFQRMHATDHVQQIEALKTHPDYPKA